MEDYLSFFDSARGVVFVILFLGGSIFVHELGHFLAAKWRGLKVERFSIGFGPRIVGWKGKDGCDYRISLLPLGGYVALPQLADMEAIEGKSALGNEPLPKISYFDKIVVFAAGAFFNVLFAFLCALILWAIKIPTTEGFSSNVIGNVPATLETQAGEFVPAPAFEAGLKPGDRILAVDGEPTENFEKIMQAIALGSGRDAAGKPQTTLTFERAGTSPREITLSPVLVSHNPRSGDFIRAIGISPIDNLTVAPVENFPAARAGILSGDRLVACDLHDGTGTRNLFSIAQLNEILNAHGAKKITLHVLRGAGVGVPVAAEITPRLIQSTRELGAIAFRENGKERTVKFVATPLNLEDFSGKPASAVLRVLSALPSDSAFAETFVPGAIVDGIATNSGGIRAVKNPEKLGDFFVPAAPTEISIFLTQPNGSGANAQLSDATFRVIPPQTRALIGVALLPERKFVQVSPWQQFKGVVDLMISSIFGLINPKSDIGIGHLNSVITISETYYAISVDIRRVLMLTVLLNINLAFLNLLPLPVLDGGHILIETIQRIRRRRIAPSVIAGVQYLFLLLFLFFMGFILMKDFSRSRGNRDLKAAELVALHQYSKEIQIPEAE